MSAIIQTEEIATIHRSAGLDVLIQALWFVFIGWWLGSLSIAVPGFSTSRL